MTPERDELYRLLEAFDALCADNGIAYFAVGDTLVGALVYQDLVPESDFVPELGILREDYAKLRTAAARTGSLKLQEFGPFDAAVSFAGEDGAVVNLHVFDWMPLDYDLRKFHVARITAWRHFLHSPLRGLAGGRIRRICRYYNRNNADQVVHLSSRDRIYVPASNVLETQRLTVGPATVSAPADTSCWIEQDRTEEERRVRLVQADCLTIMKEIDRVCREHGIGYFMCAGTLLGSLRYGGYIPWDDDIDIAMLRADYDRFLEIAPTALGESFYLQAPASEPDMPYLYAKVRLDGTEYVTAYTQLRDAHQGISIDIFPFDLAPSDEAELREHNKTTQTLYARHKDIARRKEVAFSQKQEHLRPLERLGRFVMGLHRKRYAAVSLPKARKDYEDHVERFNNGVSAFNGISAPAGYDRIVYNLINCIVVSLDDLLPLQDMPFEGLQLYGPHNPDAFMRAWFGGDYMEEPPLHKRRSHPVVRWKALGS